MRKEITMAKAMNHRALENAYIGAGYTMDMKGKVAKLCICPACFAVFEARRSKKQSAKDPVLVQKAATKVRIFSKEGSAPVAACPCGYRRTIKDGKKVEQMGALWQEEFGQVTDDRTGKCKEVAKTTGKLCNNKALPGSNKCGVHGGKSRLF
jgi:hypothetical protein